MRIFLCYRRDDSGPHVGRLADELRQDLGSDSVWRDVDSLAAGSDFHSELSRALERSDVVLVVIGPHWLDAIDAKGNQRIADPDDFVRNQIAQALQAGKRVLPVLVEGAKAPSPDQLPADLVPLTRLQFFELNDRSWQHDIDVLLHALRPQAMASARSWIGWMAALLFFCAVVAWMWLGVSSAENLLAISQWSGFAVAGTAAAAAVIVVAVLTMRRSRASMARPGRPPEADVTATDLPSPFAPARMHEKLDVFVSHAAEDHELATAIVEHLENDRFCCWIAPRDIPRGAQSWAGPIVEAIVRSRVFLVVISSHSNGSREVLREVTLANDEKLLFVVVRVDESPLSADFRYFFTAAQRMEAFGWTRERILKSVCGEVGALVPL